MDLTLAQSNVILCLVDVVKELVSARYLAQPTQLYSYRTSQYHPCSAERCISLCLRKSGSELSKEVTIECKEALIRFLHYLAKLITLTYFLGQLKNILTLMLSRCPKR